MTLSVHVFVVGEDGKPEVLDTPEIGAELAGWEYWRAAVWGSDAVRALGARYFPVLAGADLTVSPNEVQGFLDECAWLRANIDAVAPHPDPGRPQDTHGETVAAISRRLGNIEDAARRAVNVGGGVIIW
ncbi:hypothetical protein AB0J55_00145 [Amycolatopsis sp. NPDC049688]|uniref:hypothetical protein n=1 Tax=Amycolatopsis sp. NPDC049688 TaxID=3154733 RepID=UPI00343481CF